MIYDLEGGVNGVVVGRIGKGVLEDHSNKRLFEITGTSNSTFVCVNKFKKPMIRK